MKTDFRSRLAARVRRRKKRRQSPDFVPPRYDDVYVAGVKALDAEDGFHGSTDYVATLRAIGRPATRFEVREAIRNVVFNRHSNGIAESVVAAMAATIPPSPAAIRAALDKLVTSGTLTREDRGHGVVLYSVKP